MDHCETCGTTKRITGSGRNHFLVCPQCDAYMLSEDERQEMGTEITRSEPDQAALLRASETASEEAQSALRDAATKCRAADTALAATGVRGLAAIHLAYLDGATACARAEREVLARLAEWRR